LKFFIVKFVDVLQVESNNENGKDENTSCQYASKPVVNYRTKTCFVGATVLQEKHQREPKFKHLFEN